MLIRYLQKHQPFKRYIGFDTSPHIIRSCTRLMPEHEFYHLDLQQEITSEWTGVADVVVCTEVIEHLKVYKPLLANAARALKPGGTFVLTTQRGNSRHNVKQQQEHVRH